MNCSITEKVEVQSGLLPTRYKQANTFTLTFAFQWTLALTIQDLTNYSSSQTTDSCLLRTLSISISDDNLAKFNCLKSRKAKRKKRASLPSLSLLFWHQTWCLFEEGRECTGCKKAASLSLFLFLVLVLSLPLSPSFTLFCALMAADNDVNDNKLWLVFLIHSFICSAGQVCCWRAFWG